MNPYLDDIDFLVCPDIFLSEDGPWKHLFLRRFRILHVPKKCTIKQFVLSNSLEFKCGRGFYEFTKPEIVSHKKEVVQMFASSNYCQLIPAQTTAKTNLRPRWWLLRRVQVPCSRGKMPAGLLEVKLYDTIKIYLLWERRLPALYWRYSCITLTWKHSYSIHSEPASWLGHEDSTNYFWDMASVCSGKYAFCSGWPPHEF